MIGMRRMKMKPTTSFIPVVTIALFAVLLAPMQSIATPAKQDSAKAPSTLLNCHTADSQPILTKDKKGRQIVVLICSQRPITANKGAQRDPQHSGGALKSRSPFGFTLQ